MLIITINIFFERLSLLLKNKREIWKAKAKLDIMRKSAKKLVDADLETQERFISKLRNKGFNVKNIVDVLALTEEDILKRRLQTIVVIKKIDTLLAQKIEAATKENKEKTLQGTVRQTKAEMQALERGLKEGAAASKKLNRR